MDKKSQTILDILQTIPLSDIVFRRSPVSNKEAQVLYDLWSKNDTDEYGKIIINSEIDPMTIASLTTNGYVRNFATRMGLNSPTVLEITKKGKEIIKKIILHTEKSAFENNDYKVDFDAIWRSAEIDELRNKDMKVASCSRKNNWLRREIKKEAQL